MSARRRPPLSEIDARRIVLLKPSALGDIVHSLPVLTALRRRFPHAHIRWVVNQAYADLLHGHPDLDEVLVFDRGALARRPVAGGAVLRPSGRRDTAAAARSRRRSARAVPHRPPGPGQRGGPPRRPEHGPRGAPWFYTDVVPRGRFRGDSRRRSPLADRRGAGRGGAPKEFRLVVPDEARALGRRAAGRPAAAVAGRRRRLALADQALAAGILRRPGPPGAGPVRRDRRVRRRRRRGGAGRRRGRPADGADAATSPAERRCRS